VYDATLARPEVEGVWHCVNEFLFVVVRPVTTHAYYGDGVWLTYDDLQRMLHSDDGCDSSTARSILLYFFDTTDPVDLSYYVEETGLPWLCTVCMDGLTPIRLEPRPNTVLFRNVVYFCSTPLSITWDTNGRFVVPVA